MNAKQEPNEAPKQPAHEQQHEMPRAFPDGDAEGKALSIDRRQHGATVAKPAENTRNQQEEES